MSVKMLRRYMGICRKYGRTPSWDDLKALTRMKNKHRRFADHDVHAAAL